MNETSKATLEQALAAEKEGNTSKALNLFKQAITENQGNSGPVLFEMGRFLFLYGMYSEALEVLIACHRVNYRTEEVVNIIMDAYYNPNIEEFEAKYKANIDQLAQYQHIFTHEFPDFNQLSLWFIPYSNDKFAIYDKINDNFLHDFNVIQEKRELGNYKEKDILLVKDEYILNYLLNIEKQTMDSEAFLSAKLPLYLYYESFDNFVQFLQITDFTKLNKSERVVFLFGLNEINKWFSDPQAIMPTHIINLQKENDSLYASLIEIDRQKHKTEMALQEDLKLYYKPNVKENILANIKSGKPRILFVTSRFSTAIQYYIRDCVLACEKLGLPNKLQIEKSDIHRNFSLDWLTMISEFKPDIIFIIDHFRWEYNFIPENVAFISWIQDPLHHIMSLDTPAKLIEMDFLLNIYIDGKEFLSVGYQRDKLIDAVVPVNPDIYKTYLLSEQEEKVYRADICLFSNSGNPQYGLIEFLNRFKGLSNYDIIEIIFNSVYQEVYDLIYNENLFYSIDQYKDLILKKFDEFNLTIDDNAVYEIAKTFRISVGFRISRSVPMEWLHEKGYDMKLWGREWLDHPKLKKYAQGVAQNGETLSKIINASKIVIGTNPGMSTHPRVFETILSGSFYLGVNIPEQYDWANVRYIMEKDKEIVLFYSREDLYKKIDYYLANEEKRKEIINRGKEKILANHTYETMMKRVIKEIGEKIEKSLMEAL